MCYVLFTCDVWMSFDSYRLKGVFTNKKKLISAIKKLYKNGELECLDDKCPYNKDMYNYSIDELINTFQYLAIYNMKLNKLEL